MKEAKKTYNLTGLRYIFYSQVASMVLSMAGAFIEKYLICSVIVLILALVATVISIMGVFKISKYNDHFRKCRKIVVAMFVMIFLMIVALIASISSDVKGMMIVAILILPVLICIAAAVLSLMFAYHLFYCCVEIGDDQGDHKFGTRCRRGWKIYIICMISMVLTMVIAYSFSASAEELGMAAGICIIIMLVCGILSLVKIMQAVYLTFKRYDGQEIVEPPDLLKMEGAPQVAAQSGQVVFDEPLLKDEMPSERWEETEKNKKPD